MPGELTDVTELATALGMLAASLDEAFVARPEELVNVRDVAWDRIAEAWRTGAHTSSFETAFANGQAFLAAAAALRGRRPLRVEWKGPHRPPGDDVIPADLRIDHVYLVSCKYLSKVLLNPGPQRLFGRLLSGEGRGGTDWFAETAGPEFQAFYESALVTYNLTELPASVSNLTKPQQQVLKESLHARVLPPEMHEPWKSLCATVAGQTARRWEEALGPARNRLRLLWRLLRISGVTYFVLGTDKTAHLRFRVDSAWDWMQAYELRQFRVFPRDSGQPEVGWQAIVRRRADLATVVVDGHVEIRWSHGRFYGVPEAKVYLDTSYSEVPGYHLLD